MKAPGHLLGSRLFFLRWYFLCGIVLGLLLLLGLVYVTGYRPGPGLTFVRTGMLEVSDLPEGAAVYVDDVPRGMAKDGSLRVPLVPGVHRVIVEHPDMVSWSDIVSIAQVGRTSLAPIVVSRAPVTRPLNAADRTRLAALPGALPSKDSPLRLPGCVAVWVAGDRVLAAGDEVLACEPPEYVCDTDACAPLIVFDSPGPITGLVPFPGRSDALIISYGATVAALELNPLSPQFFAPVLRVRGAVLLPWSDRSVAVIEGGDAFELAFP